MKVFGHLILIASLLNTDTNPNNKSYLFISTLVTKNHVSSVSFQQMANIELELCLTFARLFVVSRLFLFSIPFGFQLTHIICYVCIDVIFIIVYCYNRFNFYTHPHRSYINGFDCLHCYCIVYDVPYTLFMGYNMY